MAITISASVGQNGTNLNDDVRKIQMLLNEIPPGQAGPDPKLDEDGRIGPITNSAILKFQMHHQLGSDGRVDPGGLLLAMLNHKAEGTPGALLHFGPDAVQVVVSTYTRSVLREILAAAGLNRATITSTSRTAEDQARVMFDNIRAKGVTDQKRLYGPNGDKVIDVYVAANAQGKSRAEIITLMVAKINELGPANVSKHAADPSSLNVVDISPRSV